MFGEPHLDHFFALLRICFVQVPVELQLLVGILGCLLCDLVPEHLSSLVAVVFRSKPETRLLDVAGLLRFLRFYAGTSQVVLERLFLVPLYSFCLQLRHSHVELLCLLL